MHNWQTEQRNEWLNTPLKTRIPERLIKRIEELGYASTLWFKFDPEADEVLVWGPNTSTHWPPILWIKEDYPWSFPCARRKAGIGTTKLYRELFDRCLYGNEIYEVLEEYCLEICGNEYLR